MQINVGTNLTKSPRTAYTFVFWLNTIRALLINKTKFNLVCVQMFNCTEWQEKNVHLVFFSFVCFILVYFSFSLSFSRLPLTLCLARLALFNIQMNLVSIGVFIVCPTNLNIRNSLRGAVTKGRKHLCAAIFTITCINRNIVVIEKRSERASEKK